MVARLLRDRADFEQHLSVDDQGYVVAQYGNWHVQSAFQPIVDRHGVIDSYEALARISTVDTQQSVSCEQFFHHAPSDNAALIHQSNLDRLCRIIHLRNYAPHHLQRPLHLNLLPATAVQAINDVLSRILMLTRVHELGIDPHHIVFEVTEDFQFDEAALADSIARMRANGFQFSVDDFGAGSSSLERVSLLAPSILKLDRELVSQYLAGNPQGLTDAVAVARQVHAYTVAEGVEDESQFKALLDTQIDFFQGYLFGRPAPLRRRDAPSNIASLQAPIAQK